MNSSKPVDPSLPVITLAEMRANALGALQELPQAPVMVQPAGLLAKLNAVFLRRSIRFGTKIIDDMAVAVEKEKAAALRDYELRLKEIDGLAAYHVAKAHLDVQHARAKLLKMGVEA